MQALFISVLIGYLLGSIPFGFLVGKARGIDIRKHGSGNIGATNVVRTLGKNWGVFVFILDVLKGAAAVQLAQRLDINLAAPGVFHPSVNVIGIVAGLACILGHNYPAWLGFKGGKGVATSAGVLVGLMPAAAGIGLLVWVISYYSSRYVSLASIIAAVSLPVIVWALEREANSLFWFSLVISTLAIWRHRSNIQRLLAGTEHRFEKKK
ncbi:MAG: glycerol-3-phosphate 1-O-acyltransferase PlsY [Verrucomicrobiota bacterium]